MHAGLVTKPLLRNLCSTPQDQSINALGLAPFERHSSVCRFATNDCGFACRAIQRVRAHSRGPVGLDARAYLIRVERRLMQFHCSAPSGVAALDAERAAE